MDGLAVGRFAALRRDVDQLLRARGPFGPESREVRWAALGAILVAAGLVYGAVMGSYGARGAQALYSALKVPMLLGLASVVCLPNFFVVNTLLGLRDDFAAAFRGVVAAQTTVSVVLASLAPVTAFAYVCGADYDLALFLNGVVFAVAAAGGQSVLQRHYRVLIARNPRHRIGRASWLVLYCFVAIQLAWVLRPFVGSPGMPPAFFREDAWSNAYVVVIDAVGRAIGGGWYGR